MTEFVGYYNGEWMPMDRITYDPSDLGPSKGDQVFETIRTFGGVSFRMKEHVDRLYRSLKYVRIDPRTDRAGDARSVGGRDRAK